MALANSDFDQIRLSGERAVDDRVDLELGGVGDHRHHVVERDLARAVGVEREFLQFVARGLAVAAEQGHQDRAGVGGDAQIRDPQLAVDQSRELARVVGIAGDRDRGLGALAGLAQRRFRPQLAGLDHDAAILQGKIRQRIDAAGETARAGADANGAAAAEQRHGHRFIDQPRRLGGELVAIEPHQREGIVGVVDRGRQQRIGAFAHEAGIGTVKQDDGTRRIGPGEKSVDLFSAKRDHWIRPSCRHP